MKAIIFFILSSTAFGQSPYATMPTTTYTAATTPINAKANWTEQSGAPAGGCTTGLDYNLQTSNGAFYDCQSSAWHLTGYLSVTLLSGLATGIVKNTTGTGALTIAIAADFPTLNQNTTGTAANLSGTPALPNGTTATTQTLGDNTTKIATDAFVLANASGSGNTTSTSLTTGKLPKANGANSIIDSSVSDNGTTVSTTEPFNAASLSSGSTTWTITGGTAGLVGGIVGTVATNCTPSSGTGEFISWTTTGPKVSVNNCSTYLPLPQAPASTTSGHLVAFNSTDGSLVADGGPIIHGISFSIGDPNGSALSTGSTYTDYVTVPFGCTIAGYNLLVDAGTITVTFWKVATGTAIPTSGNSISTSGVSISSGTAIHSTTLTDFTTTAVAANDIMAMNITAVTTAKFVNGVVQCNQ